MSLATLVWEVGLDTELSLCEIENTPVSKLTTI